MLASGGSWTGRTEFLGEWQISGYEALLDGAGQPIGMVGVSFPEADFTRFPDVGHYSMEDASERILMRLRDLLARPS